MSKEEIIKYLEFCNAWRKGEDTSQHTKGEAADLRGENNNETEQIYKIAKSLGNFDQLLFESKKKEVAWVHISYKKEGNRRQSIDNYKV